MFGPSGQIVWPYRTPTAGGRCGDESPETRRSEKGMSGAMMAALTAVRCGTKAAMIDAARLTAHCQVSTAVSARILDDGQRSERAFCDEVSS